MCDILVYHQNPGETSFFVMFGCRKKVDYFFSGGWDIATQSNPPLTKSPIADSNNSKVTMAHRGKYDYDGVNDGL